MKSFRFRYHVSVWVMLAIAILFSGTGVLWNVFNLIEYIPFGAGKIIPFAVILLLSAVFFVLSVSMAVFAKYVIKDGVLYSYFGIIRTKTAISDIVQFTHFKKSDKLVAYFNGGKYTVIVIDPAKYEEFVAEIKKYNRQIIFNNGEEDNRTEN